MTITALSRATHMATDDPQYLEKLASVGTARSDLEVSIVDEIDNPLPAGEIGEVCVRGDVHVSVRDRVRVRDWDSAKFVDPL